MKFIKEIFFMKKLSVGALLVVMVAALLVTGCSFCTTCEKAEKQQYQTVSRPEPKQQEVVVRGNGCDVCNLLKVTPHAPAEAIIGEEYMSQVDVEALQNCDEVKLISSLYPQMRYVRSEPPARVEGNKLTWLLGAMNKGQVRNIKVWVVANQEGDQFLCYVPFALPRYCVPTKVGKAVLEIQKNGPAAADLNSNVTYTILVSNKGTATAKGVVVTDQIPDGMLHESGKNVLSFEIGDMPANSTKNIAVTLKAANRGQFCNVAVAKSINAGEVNARACTTVMKKELTAALRCAPEGIVGQASDVTFGVTNPGDTALTNVVATIQFASGVRVLSAEPFGPQVPATWNIGTLKPGQTVDAHARLVGTVEGRHCTVISVVSAEGLNARAECCTLWKGVAEIAIEKTAPARAKLGEMFNYNILVKNVGTGLAKNVVVVDTLPPQVQHPEGKTLRYPIGDMAPGASKTIVVPVKAIATGLAHNVARATADNAAPVEDPADTLIQEANADLTVRCPEKTVAERDAKFDIIVKNTGGVDLTNITIDARWSDKLAFIAATRNPMVEGPRAVWRLASLAVGQEEVFQVQLVAKEPVKECLTAMLTAAEGVNKQERCCPEWIGVPAILLEVIDTVDPLFLSGDNETTYVIEVTNQGTALDRNITIRCEFPAEIDPVKTAGDTPGTIQGKRVSFQPYPVLQPKQKIKFMITTKGVRQGNAYLKTYLNADSLGREVLEEESTHVY
jgi:uncharacterized repeat protein (TIGR01451 family)